MPRPSKYTPDRVEIILKALRETGSDRAAWTAAGISADTFYEWIKKFPEFSEGVIEARKEFQDTCPETWVRQAKKAFSDYLFGRMEKVVVTSERGISPLGQPYEKEVIQRIPVGIPRWAIERVLGKPLDTLEAVQALAEAGILPKWVVQRVADEIGGARKGIAEVFNGVLPEHELGRTKPGLSDEAAAAIRAHILGVEPSGPPAVPTALDSGSKQD